MQNLSKSKVTTFLIENNFLKPFSPNSRLRPLFVVKFDHFEVENLFVNILLFETIYFAQTHSTSRYLFLNLPNLKLKTFFGD